MSLGETALTLAMGAGFTTLGFLVQFGLQTRQKARDDRQARRATWEDRCVEIMAELDLMLVSLLAPALLRVPLPTTAAPATEAKASELRRTLKRVARGHPDSSVRQAAYELEAIMSLAVPRALVEIISGSPQNLVGPHRVSTHLDSLEQRLWEFQRAVLGRDANVQRLPLFDGDVLAAMLPDDPR